MDKTRKPMHNRLAIVIPAYKGKFLTETLDSIARQDCMSFTLYIGDDCSPDDIGSIAEKYRDRINIIYRRFPENLGKTDLLAHWERCIAMTSEPYIHFFSDDDILPPDAVSRALEHVNKFPDREFFRFSLDTIDENSAVSHSNPPFGSAISTAEELLTDKLACRRTSAAIEYVFSRKLYDRTGGFVRFPLAWCSDDATWYRMAKENGIVNIPGKAVCWRNADGCNISNSNRYDKEKLDATVLFLRWLDVNWDAKRTPTFRRAVRTYISTILNTSLGGNFSAKDLFRICRASYRLTGTKTFQLFFKNIKKRK